MLRLKGKLVISRPTYSDGDHEEDVRIELTDEIAACRAVEISIPLADFARCLVGSLYVACEFDFNDSGNVGKVYEHKTEAVPLPDFGSHRRKGWAALAIRPFEVDGWIGYVKDAENHHQQFQKNGKWFASVTFHRWVDREHQNAD